MKYLLPYNEYRKLHRKAYKAQQINQLEVCGVVLADETNILLLKFIENNTTEPNTHSIEIRQIKEISRSLDDKLEIIGTFHSHPIGEPEPSEGDIKYGFYKGITLIYDVCGRDAKLWKLQNRKNKKIKELDLIMERTKNRFLPDWPG